MKIHLAYQRNKRIDRQVKIESSRRHNVKLHRLQNMRIEHSFRNIQIYLQFSEPGA